MSSAGNVKSVGAAPKRQLWSLWARQVAAILRLEVRKNFLGRRSLLIYLLAMAPVLLLAAFAAFAREGSTREATSLFYPNVYEGFILRSVIFFGCAWLFMNLFRGEVVDKSLHYYFLSPVRREVLVVGKYISGVVTSSILFGLTTVLSLLFLYTGVGFDYVVNGPGLSEGFSYLVITLMACIGYGAFFLAVGLFFRNPIIPALLAYGWEWMNFLLPPMLKKISVIHYLHSLMPVPVFEGPFSLVGEPTPAWISIPGFLIVTAIVMTAASLQIRRMQINYGTE